MPFLAPAIAAIGSAIATAGSAVATAAFVVSDVVVPGALGALGVGGASLATASALAFSGVTASIEVGALAAVSALVSPHPAVNTAGSPQQFKPDPNAGLPVVMGRYGVGGNLVYETTSGGGNSTAAGAKGNEYLTSFVILSALGPVQAFETLRFNDTILTFDPNGQACNGGYIPEDEVQAWNPGYRHQNADGSYVNNNYQDRAWQNLQLGALNAGYFAPPDKLASDNAGLPEWTQAHGFSGFCASALTLVYDQRYYAGGAPQYQWVLQGIKIYDPRLDATYPGGAGAQRWAGQGASAAAITAARGTWTFSQNPWIHALNFALGHFLPDAQTGPGRLYAGIGAGVTGVDIPAFVRAANIADANGWLICGQWTTSDGKWSVLTEMAKAGSGSIVIKNGIISCIVDTPLTSLGTITADDLSGPITLPTGASFTARLNTIFPRFTSEAHRWQMVQADTPVMAATYVAEDGAVRSKTLDWQYVPAVNQACQCAAYTICNGREIPGITLPGKPKLRNYDVGDCFTLDIPEAGLATTKVMVTKRLTDWSTGGVTLTVRTETDAKHAYSLGINGVAPATPGISGYDPTIVEAPLPANWATGILEASDPVTGEARSLIQITGSASDNIYAKFVDIRWRPVAEVAGVWTPTGAGAWSYTQQSAFQGQYPLDLNPGSYDVQIAYTTVSGAYPVADEEWLDLGVETVGGSISSNTANVNDRPAGTLTGQVDELVADVAAIQAGQEGAYATVADVTAASATAESDLQAATTQLDGDITGLNGQLATINATIGDQTGQISSLETEANGTQATVTSLTGDVATLQGSSASQAEAISSVQADAEASSSSISDLQALTATLQTGTNANAAAQISNTLAITNETSSRVQADDTLTASYQGALSSIETLEQTVSSSGSSSSETLTALQSTVESNYSAQQSFAETTSTNQEADSSDIDSLQSSVGTLDATTSEQAGTLAELSGKLLAYLQFTAAANGDAAKVTIASDGVTSTIKLIAQVLSLANSTAGGAEIDVFTVANGLVQVASKLLIGSSVEIDPETGVYVVTLKNAAFAFGPGFGANENLVLWYGPATSIATMSTANGLIWMDVNGDAEFGGALSAGIVGTAALAQYAATKGDYVENDTSTSLGAVGSAPVLIGTRAFVSTGAPLKIDVTTRFLNADGSHDQNIEIVLQRDGVQISQPFDCFARQNSAGFSGGAPASVAASFFDAAPTAASHTYSAFAQLTGGTNNQVTCSVCRIIFLELRDNLA